MSDEKAVKQVRDVVGSFVEGNGIRKICRDMGLSTTLVEGIIREYIKAASEVLNGRG